MPKITNKINLSKPESSKDSLLIHLKNNGELTVPKLCQLLNITPMAVRRHLNELMVNGLIESRQVKQATGRPVYHYHLSNKANTLFPSNFQNLANELLQIIHKQSGHKGVMDLLAQRDKDRLAIYKEKLNGKSLSEKIAEVVQIFASDGYMTEYKEVENGQYIIYQKNCALHDIAKTYRQLCILEPRFIESLLGVKVIRTEYMLKNSPVCAYLVTTEALKT